MLLIFCMNSFNYPKYCITRNVCVTVMSITEPESKNSYWICIFHGKTNTCFIRYQGKLFCEKWKKLKSLLYALFWGKYISNIKEFLLAISYIQKDEKSRNCFSCYPQNSFFPHSRLIKSFCNSLNIWAACNLKRFFMYLFCRVYIIPNFHLLWLKKFKFWLYVVVWNIPSTYIVVHIIS